MKRRVFISALLASLSLTACNQNMPASGNTAKAPVTVEGILRSVQGIDGNPGLPANAKKVVVFFDMQCPHCGSQWKAVQEAQSQNRFIWVPVAALNRASLAQGATLLASGTPVQLMNEHEASLSAGRGGVTADAGALSRYQGAIRANTEYFSTFNVNSVPYSVTEDKAGQLISRSGALTGEALAEFIAQ
jgi:thiol:disulfide interchange protein DsbG